ncbi:DUF3140 domain-containing protein [Fibrisoma montanum]|uniref:DUF3140 domain-containing protein n=1 Tax=Fibrisoma montanum TaxID=2305895 RepID=A0A418MH53_9BACT|nr:DUF3140 domain-containing protein [Fibrisoma montanum]RIV26768.1 DUF3140 domain-containing protein [Fibrisoma montanum]
MATAAKEATDKQEQENQQTEKEFKELVNMSASELKKWLDTDESKSVGQKKDDAKESTGHESGRKIIEILDKKKKDYDEDDYDQMHRTISYIKRHMAQKPKETEGSNWAYSLKNWGHDPNKK